MEAGLPTVLVATKAFEALAKMEAETWRWEQLPVITIEHPLGGVPRDKLTTRSDTVLNGLRDLLQNSSKTSGAAKEAQSYSRLVEVSPTYEEFYRYVEEQRWGDGLPVVHPTPDAVAHLLEESGMSPDDFVGRIPPKQASVKAEGVAVNAVMAGCPPEAFPVVLAAVRAALEPEFNLLGVLATTHPCGITVIVNGPIVERLGMNVRGNAMDPGNRANATIGRAVRLCMQNLGGAIPQEIDKSTQGQPGKYSFCFGENEAENPWEPYYVEKGFSPEESVVTVFASEGPHNINDHGSRHGDDVIRSIAGAMRHGGHNNLYHRGDLFLALGPEHARLLANDGWDKEKIRQYVFTNSWIPVEQMSSDSCEHFSLMHPDRSEAGDSVEGETGVNICDSPDDIKVIVTGGPGKHSSWLPGFGLTYSSTAIIHGA